MGEGEGEGEREQIIVMYRKISSELVQREKKKKKEKRKKNHSKDSFFFPFYSSSSIRGKKFQIKSYVIIISIEKCQKRGVKIILISSKKKPIES